MGQGSSQCLPLLVLQVPSVAVSLSTILTPPALSTCEGSLPSCSPPLSPPTVVPQHIRPPDSVWPAVPEQYLHHCLPLQRSR